ncbi:MAG: GNAT family N-acetyltransferase [Bacteroidetes bacterium HGW-Bacteroidetes-2]|jgi:putative acetyltransferase|nr:MAG: GNAT family N-acetyltransferase [Bacteroidetes bacterium HGW-Bacteroidetes-2]
MKEIVIRPIIQKDNSQIAKVIRDVLVEFGVPKIGTAYADTSLDHMFETYNQNKSCYFVVEQNAKIIGGAGVRPLDNFEGNVCELQKMYFTPAARGRGIGSEMIARCLKKAKDFGFEKCYLETMPYMKDAQKLYAKVGFQPLKKPMGDTGHYACNVWMLKEI